MEIKTDKEFKALISPLSSEELKQLEENILRDGCRDALVVWKDIIIDGHNRYNICTRHGIPYKTSALLFQSREDVMIWIIDNQRGRRNLPAFVRTELELKKKDLIAKKAKEKLKTHTEQGYQKSDKAVHTAKEIAKAAKVSHDTVHKVETILREAPEEIKEKARRGDVSIHEAYRETKKEELKANIAERIDTLKQRETSPPDGKYDVIVIDPPWPIEKIERDVRPNQHMLDYPTMTVEEIKKIKLPASDNCHVWLWTTQKYLPHAFSVLESWGLKYICCFVWHKPGGPQPFNLPQYNCEFALYARKGSPGFADLKAFNTCFEAGRGTHSEKPLPFYEMLMRVTAGKKLDMFNRRKIEGFDGWGNEAA